MLSGEFLTASDVLARLRLAIGAGKQKEFAEKTGVSPQFLTDVLKGRRVPTGKLLEFLGLELVESLYRERPVPFSKRRKNIPGGNA